MHACMQATHAVGPHAACVGSRLLFVEGVGFVQLGSVLLRLAVLIGETLDGLHVGEGLRGHLVGLGQRIQDLLGNGLKHRHGNVPVVEVMTDIVQ